MRCMLTVVIPVDMTTAPTSGQKSELFIILYFHEKNLQKHKQD